MMSVRRLSLSTTAPAMGEMIRFGRTPSTPTIPKSTKSLVWVSTHNGNANSVNVVPVNEIICPDAMMANFPIPGSVSADS